MDRRMVPESGVDLSLSLISIIAGLILPSLLRKELFPDLLESAFPKGPIGNPGEAGTRPPIKTFGGDAFGINSYRYVPNPRAACGGVVHLSAFQIRPV